MKQKLPAQNQEQKRVESSLQINVKIILRSPGIGIFRFSIQYSFVLQIFLLYVKLITANKSEMFLYLLTELFFFPHVNAEYQPFFGLRFYFPRLKTEKSQELRQDLFYFRGKGTCMTYAFALNVGGEGDYASSSDSTCSCK